MRTIKKQRAFLFVAIFSVVLTFLGSCENDSIDDLEQKENKSYLALKSAVENDSASSDCFELKYPLEIVFEDKTTLVVNSEEEEMNAMDKWFEANPDNENYPTFTFPVTIINGDGTESTINSDEDLFELYMNCFDEEDLEDWYDDDFGNWDDDMDDDDMGYDDYDDMDDIEYIDTLCFRFVYPVTVVNPNGTSSVANNDDELFEKMDNWEGDDNIEDFPTLQFPIEVILPEGTKQTVASDDELEKLFEACLGDFDDMDISDE